jgi:hypothetical protein
MATSHAILYVTSSTTRTYVRSSDGWVEGQAAHGARWYVVTNLIDERFVRIDMPEMGGSDQRDYLEVQLNTLFSGNVFRTTLPYKSDTNSAHRVLTGIGGGHVDEAIQKLADSGERVVGVWSLPTLLMNALIKRRQTYPSTLLAMMPTTDGMRMLFINAWQPVLTRLLPLGMDVDQLIEEVMRTRHYLVDGKFVEAHDALPLLIFDSDLSWSQALESQGFVVHAPWKSKVAPRPVDNLFNAVVSEPPGQLASLQICKVHVTGRLRTGAMLATAVVSGLSIALTAGLAFGAMDIRVAIDRAQQELERRRDQSAEINRSLEVVRYREGAMAAVGRLTQTELAQEQSVVELLRSLSQALTWNPEVRLNRLEWRHIEPDAACLGDGQAKAMGGQSPGAPMTQFGAGATKPAVGSAAIPSPRVLEVTLVARAPTFPSPLDAQEQQQRFMESLRILPGVIPKLQKGAVSLNDDFSAAAKRTEPGRPQSGDQTDLVVCLVSSGGLQP